MRWRAAITAYGWVQEIKGSYVASEDFRIGQMESNDDNDITVIVKNVRPNFDLL